MTEFRKKVETVEEYKEVLEHAQALGFEPVEFSFSGTWDVAAIKKEGNKTWTRMEEHPSWPGLTDEMDVTQKYFEVEMDGDLCRIQPRDEDSLIWVTFRG